MIKILAWTGTILLGLVIYVALFWVIPFVGTGTLWNVLAVHVGIGGVVWGVVGIGYLTSR